MANLHTARATLDDLLREPGKAELIDGRIVRFMSTGHRPAIVGGNIFVLLRAFAKLNGGVAYPDNVGFVVPELASGRESFSPDASYYNGPLPANPMKFIEGAPTLAVEVRSENDYGPAAETELAAKRRDYFEAGTLMVWDVDTVAGTVTVYRSDKAHAEERYEVGQKLPLTLRSAA